jgi:hypothetical protein
MLNQRKPKIKAQAIFDSTYITAHQIMSDLEISRPALLYARRSGKLPDPIILNDGRLYIWELKDIQVTLNEWKEALNTRRGV